MTKPICGARKASGNICQAPAGSGTDHPGWGRCRWHSGCSPGGGIGSAVEQSIDARAEALGIPVEIDPANALIEEVYRTVGHIRWARDQIARWDISANEPIPPHQEGWLRWYRREREHLARTAKAVLDSNVAERLVRQIELEGRIVARALEAGLAAVGLSGEAKTIALEAAKDSLASLDKQVVEGDIIAPHVEDS